VDLLVHLDLQVLMEVQVLLDLQEHLVHLVPVEHLVYAVNHFTLMNSES
jgi:hypothetical protein